MARVFVMAANRTDQATQQNRSRNQFELHNRRFEQNKISRNRFAQNPNGPQGPYRREPSGPQGPYKREPSGLQGPYKREPNGSQGPYRKEPNGTQGPYRREQYYSRNYNQQFEDPRSNKTFKPSIAEKGRWVTLGSPNLKPIHQKVYKHG